MTEHEQLKAICEKIGYENLLVNIIKTREWSGYATYNHFELHINKNVREIIFTQEFMDKYLSYYLKQQQLEGDTPMIVNMMNHLDNIVEYIYDKIKE